MSSNLLERSAESETIRVLHVDDEPDLGELTATFLEQIDDRFSVETATSASDGLEILEDEDIDCIISDYDMPGLNGIEFLERVRDDAPDLPFILFTGKGSEEVASDAISAGVTDYLQKSSGTDQYTVLANRVSNAVDKWNTERQLRDTKERYERILEHLSDYVLIVDESGDISYASPAIERMMGYEPAEVIGTNAFEYVHPDDRDMAAAAFAETLEQTDEEVSIEYRAKTKGGSDCWIEARGGNYLDDPLIEGVMVSVREISGRKD